MDYEGQQEFNFIDEVRGHGPHSFNYDKVELTLLYFVMRRAVTLIDDVALLRKALFDGDGTDISNVRSRHNDKVAVAFNRPWDAVTLDPVLFNSILAGVVATGERMDMLVCALDGEGIRPDKFFEHSADEYLAFVQGLDRAGFTVEMVRENIVAKVLKTADDREIFKASTSQQKTSLPTTKSEKVKTMKPSD